MAKVVLKSEKIRKKLEKVEAEGKKKQDEIKRLTGQLSAAKKKENAERRQTIGKAIEDAIGVGELSQEEVDQLIKWFITPLKEINGEIISRSSWLHTEITKMREAAKQQSSVEEEEKQ